MTRAPGMPRRGGANPIVLRQKGADLFRMAKYAEAVDAFQAAIARNPLDFVSHRFILMALFRLGRAADVDRKAADIAAVFPDAQLLVAHFALVLRESGYPDLAAKIFRESLKLDPRRVDAWVNLGNLSFDKRDFDEAFRCYAKALELKPDSLEALANTGKVYTIWKDYEKALPYLEKALSLKPDYATALSTLGGVHIERREFAVAEETLTRALGYPASKETKLTIHGNLGILYFKLRDREKAIRSFEKVLELDPTDAQAAAALERLRR